MDSILNTTPPPSPAAGDQWTDVHGRRFVWTLNSNDTGQWVQLPVAQSVSAQPMVAPPITNPTPKCTTSATPPLSPTPNDLWFDTTTGFFFIFYNDGNTYQWVVTNPGRGSDVVPPPSVAPVLLNSDPGIVLTPDPIVGVGSIGVDTTWLGGEIGDVAANYLPLTGGTLTGPGNLTVNGKITKANLVETAGTATSIKIYDSGTGLTNSMGTSASSYDFRAIAAFNWYSGATPTLLASLGANGRLTLNGLVTNPDANQYALYAGRYSAGFGRVALNTQGAYGWEFQVNGVTALQVDAAAAVFSGTTRATRVGVGMAPSATATSTVWSTGDVTLNGANHAYMGNLYFDSGWKYTAGGATAAAVKMGIDTTTAYQLLVAPNNAGAAGATAVPVSAMTVDGAGNVTFSNPVVLNGVKIGSGTLTNFAGYGSTALTASVQVASTNIDGFSTQRYSAGGNGPIINLSKSSGATVGTQAIVANGNFLGAVNFNGSDGVKFVEGAYVRAEVDGTPGVDDMPTRLTFGVSRDGTAASVEAMRISNTGAVALTSAVPATPATDAFSMSVANPGGNTGNIFRLRAGAAGTTDQFKVDMTGDGAFSGSIQAFALNAPPAGGGNAFGMFLGNFSGGNLGVYFGAGNPTVSCFGKKGSIYLDTTGAIPWYNVDGLTTWAQLGGGGASISVGDTPPGSPTAGALWWNSVLGTMFIYYNDGNTTQWVPAAPSAATATSGVMRLYDEQVLTVAANQLRANIPLNAKVVELYFGITANASANETLNLFGLNGAALINAAIYSLQVLMWPGDRARASTRAAVRRGQSAAATIILALFA